MAFFKRLFGQRDRQAPASPTRGPSDALQTEAQPGSSPATTQTGGVATQETVVEGAAPEASDREQAIVAKVAETFPRMILETRAVEVHTLEGSLSATLRFTLNESASTDLQQDRIAANKESVEELADVVIVDLRRQLGG